MAVVPQRTGSVVADLAACLIEAVTSLLTDPVCR